MRKRRDGTEHNFAKRKFGLSSTFVRLLSLNLDCAHEEKAKVREQIGYNIELKASNVLVVTNLDHTWGELFSC